MARDKALIIANWKMNLGVHDASLYIHKLSKSIKIHRNVEVVIAPTLLTLQTLSLQVNLKQIKLAAQNFYWRDHGAYTGEVSAAQLSGIVQYAMVGHSERRNVFNESDKDLRAKVQAAIRNGIRPILCVGETAGEKSNNETQDVLHDQLIGGLANITGEELEKVVIAYEPVWAIGASRTPTTDEITAAIRSVRSQIKHLYGTKASQNIQVLYGASVTPDNAGSFLELPDVDGLLIGGASLDEHAFTSIIEIAHETKKFNDK